MLRDRLLPAIAALSALLPGPRAQDPLPREVPKPIEFVAGQDDNLFSLRRSQEDIHEWEQALAEIDDGKLPSAVERLHKLLQSEIGGVVPVAPARFLGLRLAVILTLANLSPAGQEAYEALIQREAGHYLERPLPELGEDQLELLAHRYPTSRLGRAARLRLGDLRLLGGDGLGAICHFRQALDAAAVGSSEERAVTARIAAARTLADPRRARLAQRERRLDPIAESVLDVLPPSGDPSAYPCEGGGGDGSTPMSEPAGSPRAIGSGLSVRAPGFSERDSGLFAMRPVGDLDGIFVNTGRQVIAFDPLRGTVAWDSIMPLPDDGSPFDRGSALEGINEDCVLAAAVGGNVVVAPLQVPELSSTVDFQNGLRIISKIPERRLFAFDRVTGKLVWSHFDSVDGQATRRFRGHDACGPPLVAGDTVYVPTHDRAGAIAFSVAAYNLLTGELKWRRLVCSSQQEVNMFGNARSEFAASPLCLCDGVLYGASNLGVAFAIDAATGQSRWVRAYEITRMPTASFRQRPERTIYFFNNAPVAVDGTVCLLPLDSPFVLGLDTETGNLRWALPAEAAVDGDANDVRWLAGALDDEFVLTGRGAIAVKARPTQGIGTRATVRQLVAPEHFRHDFGGAISGRPAVTGDRLWVGRFNEITAFDRAGNELPAGEQLRSSNYQGGNLLLVDGIVVSLRLNSLEILLDRAAEIDRVERRFRDAPDDPGTILRLATLRGALLERPSARERQAVTDLYRRGLAACERRGLPKSHPVRAALQRELFDQAIAAAETGLMDGAANAFELLATARDAAPDVRTWLLVQERVLQLCAGDPARESAELDRLEHEGAGRDMPLPGGDQPVRAYVLYRRAQLATLAPAARVAAWQELLENFPAAQFRGDNARDRAAAAIAELVAANGPACYADVQRRAEAALRAAGDDNEALRDVGAHFPNSSAAADARTRLLDKSVAAGDLASACDVLAQELGKEQVSPGVLRRVLVAASARGNRGLARAMADHLRPHAAVASNWPADGGRTYGEVLGALAAELADPPAPNRLQPPGQELARVKPRTPRESFQMFPTLVADGFTAPADVPLYVELRGPEKNSDQSRTDLCAIDLNAPGPQKPILFAEPVLFLENVVLCGTTLIVPDIDRVFAIDYRTGELRWQLAEPSARSYESLGVQGGVLHLSASPNDITTRADFLGIEPLTGRVLFRRTIEGDGMRPVPKAVDGQLLFMRTTGADQAAVLRLDPLRGNVRATIPIAHSALFPSPATQAQDIAERIYPQGLLGDAERVYLPIDSTYSNEAPRLVAFTDSGDVAWRWTGLPNTLLRMAALRGDRLVLVEASDERAGRVSILRASDGTTIQETPLGYDIQVHNWQRSWSRTPAPPLLVLSDLASPSGREHRIYGIGLADGMPSFVESLGTLGDVQNQPQVGDDFVTFGVRPLRREPFRLYSLQLRDRAGALPGGQKYRPLSVPPSYALSSAGPYTVLCCAEYLVVLGAETEKR